MSDAELNRLINVKLAKLWNFLATQYTDMFVSAPTTLTVVSGQEWISLPSDFLMCVGLFGLDGDDRIKIKPFNMEDLSEQWDNWGFEYTNSEAFRYRIMGRRLYLMPDNIDLEEIELWYVTTAPKLESDADTLPFDLPAGWDECIVNGVAALVRIKEESDPTILLGLETQCYKELEQYAVQRDAARPGRVVDVTGWHR